MPDRLDAATEQEHTSALSGTPTAWITLALLLLVTIGWIFLNPITCGVLRVGLTTVSWWRGDALKIQHLGASTPGWIEARGVEFFHGPPDHRSSLKLDEVRISLEPLGKILFPGKNHPRRLIRSMELGHAKVLLDRRLSEVATNGHESELPPGSVSSSGAAAWDFLPTSFHASPVDLIVIGSDYRIAVTGLNLRLPERWTGRISYNEAQVDFGNFHQDFPKTSAAAVLEGDVLRIGALNLGKQTELREITLSPREGGIEFGLKAVVGNGQVRGDGLVGTRGNRHQLDITLVGENLNLAAMSQVVGRGKSASGTLSQARLTFRGDTTSPMDAESSLRLIARDVHWQDLDLESLRVAATMTGRKLTLSELTLEQQGNEIVAEGQSQLPSDWQQALRSPFTALFHADLQDAHAVALLAGNPLAQVWGRIYLEGEIHGSDNKASGYCNVTGSGMKIRDLPLDWVKGCLLFEGEKTRLSYLEARSGEDRISLEGTMANSRPHTYEGSAEFGIRNLAKRLTQLGFSPAPAVGSGGAKGTWRGNGSVESHSGEFQADVTDWVSSWTTTGMSGRFEGAYAPGTISLSKAEARQDGLKVVWKLTATPQKLQVSSITATREGRAKPLVEGSFSLPVNAADLWQSGDVVRTLGLADPLEVRLFLHGIDAQELAAALGQKPVFVGILDGTVMVSGTCTDPEIHTALRVAHFEVPKGTPANDLSMTLEATNGRLTAIVHEEPEASSPLSLKLDIPLHLTSDQGLLRLARNTSPVQGEATFRKVSMEGWASSVNVAAWPLRDSTVNGALTLSGTLLNPDLHGALTLTASTARLFGETPLSNLVLPVVLTNTAATIDKGSAFYAKQPVSIAGSLDWNGGTPNGSVHLTGTNLPLTIVPGVQTAGRVDLLLGTKGTNPPLLSGTIELTSLESRRSASLTPFFAPPGIATAAAFQKTNDPGVTTPLQVDLAITTAGSLPVTPGGQTRLSTDLHLRGSAATPRMEGGLAVANATIDLPSGKFYLPAATLQLHEEGDMDVHAEAFGITRHGLCALDITKTGGQTVVSLPVASDETAAEMIRGLSQPPAEDLASGFILQSDAWLRQKMMLPMPATAWAMSRLGSNTAEALGFYGSPWVLNWDFFQQKPSKENNNN